MMIKLSQGAGFWVFFGHLSQCDKTTFWYWFIFVYFFFTFSLNASFFNLFLIYWFSFFFFYKIDFTFLFTTQELPINIKFCFEGMEESGSEGLDELIFARKDTFLKDVDYVCISDNYWLGKTKPCITYGLRGICYFFLEVKSPFFSQLSQSLTVASSDYNLACCEQMTQVISYCHTIPIIITCYVGGMWLQRPSFRCVWWLCSWSHDWPDCTYG